MKSYKIIPLSWLTTWCFSLVVSNICYTTPLSTVDCPGLKLHKQAAVLNPPPGQNNLCTQAAHRTASSGSLGTEPWDAGVHRRDKGEEELQMKIPRKRAADGGMRGKWKINLPKHTSFLMLSTRGEQERGRWWLLGPPVCLSACLPLCLQGRCRTSSVWDGAVCCVSHLFYVTRLLPSRMEPQCNSEAPEQQKHRVYAGVNWMLHTTSKQRERESNEKARTRVWTGIAQLWVATPARLGTRMSRETDTERLDLWCRVNEARKAWVHVDHQHHTHTTHTD